MPTALLSRRRRVQVRGVFLRMGWMIHIRGCVALLVIMDIVRRGRVNSFDIEKGSGLVLGIEFDWLGLRLG